MSAYTPGPWMIGLGGGGHRHSHTIQQKVAGTQSAVIATIDTIIGPGGHDEGEANLHLIAAAPELLEALQRMLDLFDDCRPPSHPVITRARAIIARVHASSDT